MEVINSANLITSFGENFIKINNTNKIVGNTWLLDNGTGIPANNIILDSHSLNIKVIEDFLKSYALQRDILLVGCGKKFTIPSFELKSLANKEGFSLEWMITRSAIQTWNLLIEDYRNVLALFFLE